MTNYKDANGDLEHYQNDEIDLRELLVSIASRKKFIIGFSAIVTVLAILYALSITPTYKASISFLSPGQSSVIELNKIKLTSETSETSETIYQKFLNKFMSREFQRKVFDENDYLAKLNPKNEPIDNLDNFFYEFSKSLNLQTIKTQKNVEKINFEKPVEVTIEGSNAKVIADYLNDLASSADKENIDEFLSVIEQKIAIRLEEIDKQKGLLLSGAKKDRLNKIAIIKEQDNQKTKEINDKIERLRVKAKKDRLNQIQVLTDAAILAKELGIKKNNFKQIDSNDNGKSSSTLTVSIADNQKVPDWYLYGEDALLQRIDVLSSRDNDNPYVPEIVNLQNQLKAISSNQTLKTLENRTDDSPFIGEINTLDIEAIRLKSFKPSSVGINSMQLNQHAFPANNPIKPNKRLIVLVAAVAGFILSIFLVLLMNAFRPKETS